MALVVTLAPGVAGAHVELIESDPPVDGEATAGVTSVVLTMAAFDPDRPVEVEVTDPAGEDVTAGEPDVDVARSTVEVPTAPLREGRHIVHWHAWADDGDGLAEGTFTFSVVESPSTGWGIWLVWIAALGIPAAILLRPGARRTRAD